MEEQKLKLNAIIDDPASKLSYKEKELFLDELSNNIILNYPLFFNIPNEIFYNDEILRYKLNTALKIFNSYYCIKNLQKFFIEDNNIINILYFYGNIFYITLGKTKAFYKLTFSTKYAPDYEKDGKEKLYTESFENLVQRLSSISDDFSLITFQIINHVSSTYSKFESQVNSLKNHIAEQTKECKEIANNIKRELNEAMQKFGLSGFAGSFDSIEKEEKDAKQSWLVATGVLGVLAIVILGYNLWDLYLDSFNFSLKFFIPKALTSAFLFIAAFWCSKRYSIARSQEISYRHIATILKTYDMFKISAKDATEKDIIITEMAHTIFTLPKLPNVKTVENDQLLKMVELLKLFNKSE